LISKNHSGGIRVVFGRALCTTRISPVLHPKENMDKNLPLTKVGGMLKKYKL